MKIAIAADHAGFELKEHLRASLQAEGYDVADHGTKSIESVDYPDFAGAVARDVASGKAERGVLVCSTGIGMSIAANKVHGVRAALVTNEDQAHLTRHHNDANVIALGARYTDEATADQLVKIFLETGFDGGRHERRVEKITKIESTE